ncbi:MAG: HEAT repeat domain-containing protein [Chloroflexota bacterium]
MNLLDQQAMRSYIKNGYVTLQPDFPPEFHQQIYAQTEAVFESGNPGNDILPKVRGVAQVFDHPLVVGALSTILGPDYVMHPHRHCHLNMPGTSAQTSHQDSYEDDENVRQHRTRWAMAFYYPQDVTSNMGPTGLQPGTQYFYQKETTQDMPEVALSGPAGTVTIVHYDVWHRAMKNDSDKKRYMMKFLFCRMSEPEKASINSSHHLENLMLWHTGNCSSSISKTKLPSLHTFIDQLKHGTETDRITAAYALGQVGSAAVPTVLETLQHEAIATGDQNLKRGYTNPSQLYSVYALSNLGTTAVSAVVEALRHPNRWVRAAAAAVLADMGREAQSSVPHLTEALSDQEMWVRRNAVEALGIICPNDMTAVAQLCQILQNDEAHRVRHNAALALARIRPNADFAVAALGTALNDENLYVRGNTRLALKRINTVVAHKALANVPELSSGGYHAATNH